MVRIKYLICLLISFFIIETKASAQDTVIYEGMTWYLNRSAAFNAARSQGKQVLLIWGRTTCGICKGVRQRLGQYPLKPIVDKNYILWFSNCDVHDRNSSEVGNYLAVLTGSVALPALCVIDMYDDKVAHGLTTGPKYEAELREILNRYVANDVNTDISNKVFVSGNNLFVKSETVYEIISLYSITGSLLDRFYKEGYDITYNLSGFNKGIYIVTGSSGWTQKIFVR